MLYSERGSKMAIVTVLWPKIAYDTAWSLYSEFAGTIHVYWPTNKNAKRNQRNIKLLTSISYPFPFRRFYFFQHT